MFDRFGEIHDGMDVYDRDGDKIGTIKHVYTGPAASGGYTSTGTVTGTMGGTMPLGVFQVDTGFLGLGKDYFVPFSAVTGVSGDRVTLDVDKDFLNQSGWDQRPAWVAGS
jgi:hypothetical protein